MIKSMSWRWQLVLGMVLVGSIALGSFIIVAHQSVRASAFNKLDTEIMSAAITEGRPVLSHMLPAAHLPPPPRRNRPPAELTGSSGSAFAFHDHEADLSHRSRDWPEELEVRILAERIRDLYRVAGLEFPEAFHLHSPPPGSSGRSWNRPPPPPPGGQPLPRLDPVVYDRVVIDGQLWRLMGFSNGEQSFMAIRSLDDLNASMAAFWRAVSFALPISLILIGATAWFLAGGALSPVRRLTRAASTITASSLEARLAQKGEPEEFRKLIDVYNRMLDRLEASFAQARRFSADAAHELNTPLTILQGNLDSLLQNETDEDRQTELTTALEETQYLREIIKKLHLLSQADAGCLPVDSIEVDFTQLVSEVVSDGQAMAPNLSFDFQWDDPVITEGDPGLLRQLVFNLVSNAVKYNRPGGTVTVQACKGSDSVCLEITNTGNEISGEDSTRIFERFYRVDPSRDARIPGRGLGLSLALEFARAHGGTLRLVENEPDKISFRLELPA